MDRLVRFNVLAKSGRAVEAAGDIDTLLLDKTGTITIGDRAGERIPPGRRMRQRRRDWPRPRCLASLADETPEGRSIVVLARERVSASRRDTELPEGRRICHPLHRADAHLRA